MRPLHELSVAEGGSLLREGGISSAELTEHALTRIASLDPLVHAFVLVTTDRALEDAERADREMAAGIDRGPMHGIPYALKDVFATAAIRTTCHSRLLVDHVPREDCAIEESLKKGGGVLLGKLAAHEYALGGPSFDLPFPPARNPWSLDHVPGASSSGSGAAVAAGFVPVAIGSDTSGSIRVPAGHCGVVGLKPTYGLVSRRGAFPLSYSLDHCGPLTWTVEDTALVMRVIGGHDPLDPSSADVAVPDFTSTLGRNLRGMRIAFGRDFYAKADEVSPEVVALLDAAARRLTELGAVVEEVTLPAFELFNACGRVIMTAEAYAIHEDDLRRRPLDYGRYTYQRIVPGAGLSAADLTQALRLRRELATSLNAGVLASHDALITAIGLAPPARFSDFPADWPPPGTAAATRTIPFNVTGNPTLALPVGFSTDGLPVGMQIVGRAFDDSTVLRIAAAHEAAAHLAGTRADFEPVAR